mmetsp:Transcript_10616/g.18827  ORF Transcript_10616/g.18827 Transcript_10616/m.18827 type:complete len:155 (-) Transcript_10616:713-1177(-)
MDFRKAFDMVLHHMLEAFLTHAGLPKRWVAVILSFLKGPIGFLVGGRVSSQWVHLGGGIREGDTPFPALFALITALLCRKLEQHMPGVRMFLYADNSLLWIEGPPQEVSRAVAELKDIIREYGDYTGQQFNLWKCSAILQGEWGPLPITHIEGI